MANVAVIGAQWGDEGKGKVVDWLASRAEAEVQEQRGEAVVGGERVWARPSKPDAYPPSGLEGLSEIWAAVSVRVDAIGGIDVGNAAACIAAGAAGVAVVRAAADAGALLRALGDRAAV